MFIGHIFYLLLVLTLSVNYATIEGSLSGVYIDNGFDQTIRHKLLDENDKVEVGYEILDLLGLPDRPNRKHKHPSLRKSAPKFLLDIYHRLNDENDEKITRVARSADEDNIITEGDQKAIDESDVIMTFLSKNHHHSSDFRHDHGRRLKFDVSEISDDVLLMMAELKIYQNSLLASSHARLTNEPYIITAFAIDPIDEYEDLQILSSVNTTSSYHGWLKLNVTDALARWMQSSTYNKGLYITAHSASRPEKQVKLDDIGLVNARGDDQYQPFMVGYFKGQEIIKSPSPGRKKRNAPRRRKKSEMRNPLTEHQRAVDESKSCQIHTLYVHFRDLKWQDWIIAPEGYGAFYCSGVCNFPLNAHMNATNHAIVQTLVHLMQPNKVPKPCCAPTTLSAISVLYYLNEENVNLKKYKNMVVKSCGCH